jgi:predicted house-cleaning noncanonical NTP pyrophosphatase (MazG superfamily)
MIFSANVPRVDWSEVRQFGVTYGSKGATSLALPRAWTPAFALIPASLVDQAKTTGKITTVMDDNSIERIRGLAGPEGKFIIRSSVIGESIWERGTYSSVQVDCTLSTFLDDYDVAAWKVITSAKDRPISLMVQTFVQPTSRGEFGNLLRISKTRDHWEVSSVDQAGLITRIRLNSQRDQAADPEEALIVRSGRARERLFGSIGAWLNNELLRGRSQRLNCEWITDNRRFYLVQIDEEDEDLIGINPFQVRIPQSTAPIPKNGNFLKIAEGEVLSRWDKLQVLSELWEPEATHKPVLFFVCLADLPLPSSESGLAALEADFRDLIAPDGVVVRTSVVAGEDKIPNLPRTECLTPRRAAEWCVAKALELRKEHDPAVLAFVTHHFVASRASAWVRAEPRNPTVEINALWGLPDALQFCSYDIWELHVPTGVATDYPDYKSDMLVSKPDGSWAYERVKNELARNNSIGSTEAKDLANRSSAIADRLGRACHIMWFVGCVDEKGILFNMPWYWTKAHSSERNPDRSAYRILTVSDEKTLREFIDWKGPRTRQALALRPTNLDLMRDTPFIEAVASAAVIADVPVILYGSTLAHAYYQLRKAGCTIVTPSEKERFRVRHSINLGKLVRDKIPSRIAERQEREITRRVPTNLMKGYLISKLFEEAIEVREATDVAQKTEELADIFEVYRAIAKVETVALDAVVIAADRKKQKAGGFDEGFILLQTGVKTSDQVKSLDPESVTRDVLPTQLSGNSAEIPFTFFGFMPIDQPRSIYFKEFGLRLEIVLRSDRIELRLVREAEQLELPLGEDES